MPTVQDLIQESINRQTVAYARYDAALADELFSACDDYADGKYNDGDTCLEYWGETADGCEWRVHLKERG